MDRGNGMSFTEKGEWKVYVSLFLAKNLKKH